MRVAAINRRAYLKPGERRSSQGASVRRRSAMSQKEGRGEAADAGGFLRHLAKGICAEVSIWHPADFLEVLRDVDF